MKITESELFEALGGIDLSIVDQARRASTRRRTVRYVAAAACLGLLFLFGAAFIKSERNAAILPERPVFYAIDGKLYKRANDLTAILLGMLPSSCTDENSAALTPVERAEFTPTPSQAPERTPSPSETPWPTQKPGLTVIVVGDIDPNNPPKTGSDSVVIYCYGEGSAWALVPAEGEADHSTASISFEMEPVTEDGSPFYFAAPVEPGALYENVKLRDVTAGFDASPGVSAWVNGQSVSGDIAERLYNCLAPADSITLHELAAICAERELGVTGDPSGFPDSLSSVDLVLRSGSGLTFNAVYYPEAGCFSAMGTYYFRLDPTRETEFESLLSVSEKSSASAENVSPWVVGQYTVGTGPQNGYEPVKLWVNRLPAGSAQTEEIFDCLSSSNSISMHDLFDICAERGLYSVTFQSFPDALASTTLEFENRGGKLITANYYPEIGCFSTPGMKLFRLDEQNEARIEELISKVRDRK